MVQSSLVSDIEASFLSRGTAVNSSLNSRLLTCHQWPNQWCIQKSTHGPMELQVFIIIQKRQIFLPSGQFFVFSQILKILNTSATF